MSFLDDWKEWSTAKKAISIIAVCCLGLIIIAMITGGGTPDKNTASTTDNNNSADTSNQAKGVQVKIIADGSWSGSIGSGSSQSSYDGTGEKTIDIDNSGFNIVSAAIQKKSGDSSELKVQILKDGKVLKEASTTAEYGVVSLSENV